MIDGDLRYAFDIGNRTGDFENFEIATCREVKLVGGGL